MEANKIKCILRPTSLFTSKATGLFNYTVLNCIDIYDVNLTISPLYRPITAEFTKGFSVTYQHPLQTIQIRIIILQITQQTIDLCPPMII